MFRLIFVPNQLWDVIHQGLRIVLPGRCNMENTKGLKGKTKLR